MTSLWGPSAWKFMHYVTFAYPDHPTRAQKMQYMRFFRNLPFVLPCPVCGAHFQKEVNKLTMNDMKSMDTLSRWLVAVHNRVNRRLGKPVIPYDRAKRRYISSS